jgi:UDP-glucose 4-epimerase
MSSDHSATSSKIAIGLVGARGFIGSHLLKDLGKPNIYLKAFTREDSVLDKNNELNSEIKKLDVLVWAASGVNPSSAEIDHIKKDHELEYWRIFLKELSIKAPDLRIIYLSSGGCTYSGNDSPFCENSTANGTNAYGQMKIQIETMLLEQNLTHQILRLSNVYGPGQRIGMGQGVIAEWIDSAIKENALRVYGSLESYRDYIFIDDVVSAVKEVALRELKGNIYNVGSGKPLTLKNLYSILSNFFAESLSIIEMPHRNFDRLGYVLNIDKIMDETNWKQQVDVHTGVEQTLKHELINRGKK